MMYRIALGLLCLTVGCKQVADQDLAKRIETSSLKKSEEHARIHSCFKQGEFPSSTWWEMFHDTQLSSLIEKALQQNPSLQSAFAKIKEAEQEAKMKRASLLPTLDGDYAENWEYFSKNGFVRSFYPAPPGVIIPPKINQVDLSLSFRYEFDFFGRNRHRFQAAINEARAMRAEAAMTRLVITTLVAQTYIELQMKQEQRVVLENKIQAAEKLLQLSALNFDAGLDPLFAPLSQEVDVYTLQKELVLLDKQIALDTHMLAFLVGEGADEVVATAPLQVSLDNKIPLPQDLSSDLIARRPDLIAQIWKVEAAAEQIGAAKADFYPRVNLIALAGLEGLNFNQLFQWASRQGALDPAIHLPIFTGGALTANLKKQVAFFNDETYQYNEMVLRAVKEVADDISTLIATFEALNYEQANVEAVALQWELTQHREQAGLDSSLKVLLRQLQLLNQESLFIECHRNYLLSVVKLIKALGGGYNAA